MPPYRRKAVRAEIVEVMQQGGVLRVRQDTPTPERLAKGDLRVVQRLDANGHLMSVPRAVTPVLIAQLQLAGDRGENIVQLQAAAEWFIEQGENAQMRGRMVHSQLVSSMRGTEIRPLAEDVRIARINLARIYDVLGFDGFGMLYDVLFWEIEPRGPLRAALFRAALHALARALNAKNPR
jgi:hypothetical protein